jgi:2'-5' RNA ligase
MRLFYALVPDDAVRASLAREGAALARDAGGRAIPAVNVHVTVVFVGGAATRLPCLRDALQTMPRTAFTLSLDRIGGWRAAGVAWLAPSLVPPALATLHDELNAAVAACGLPPETRPFRPHVTLVRRPVRLPREAAVAPIAWHVRRLALMRSDDTPDGVRYREVDAVALA